MVVNTVGELKKILKEFNDDMQLDLYICIRRDEYGINGNEPLKIYIPIDNGKLKFENERIEDMELSD